MKRTQPQLQKIWDEGTTTPFVARIFLGMMELRDLALQQLFSGKQLEAKKLAFDETLKPLLDSLRDARQAVRDLNGLIKEHAAKVADGSIVERQRSVLSMKESIDAQAGRLLREVFDRGYTGMKGIQAPLKALGLDIGWFFQKERLFENGLGKLRETGEPQFATYLEQVRMQWSQRFLRLRADHAHEGWSPPTFSYRDNGISVELQQPILEGLPMLDFSRRTASRLMLFAENSVAYATSRILRAPLVLEEIPADERDPNKLVRFRLGLDQSGTRERWYPRYSEDASLMQERA